VNEQGGHRVRWLDVVQAGRHPAGDGGEHRHLVARLEREPVRQERAVGDARDHGPVRPGAVLSG
jgi:hypothetical protein